MNVGVAHWGRYAWIALCLGLALAGCGGSDDSSGGDPATDKLAQIVARGTIIGFFEPDYAPQSLAVEGAARPTDTKCNDAQLTGAEVTGYDIEMTKLLAEALGVEPCFVSPPWTEVTSGNWGDRWDIAYGSGAITADRMERLFMTRPYYATANRYFVQKDSAFQRPSDLDGKKIGVCVSCSQEAYLKGELELPGTEVVVDVKSPEIVVFEVEDPASPHSRRARSTHFSPVTRSVRGSSTTARRSGRWRPSRSASISRDSWIGARGSRRRRSSRRWTRSSRNCSTTEP